MLILVPSICLWIPYMLDSSLPRNATLAGYFNEGDMSKSYHLYAVRTWEDGEFVPVRQTHSQHHWAIKFKRGSNDFIKAEMLKAKMAEILTCDTEFADLRWIKYDPMMDLESCIPYGTTNLGETGYVGRTFARKPTDSKIYGSIPGFFVPSDGFLTVYLGGLVHSTDVEVLCVHYS